MSEYGQLIQKRNSLIAEQKALQARIRQLTSAPAKVAAIDQAQVLKKGEQELDQTIKCVTQRLRSGSRTAQDIDPTTKIPTSTLVDCQARAPAQVRCEASKTESDCQHADQKGCMWQRRGLLTRNGCAAEPPE